MANGKKLFLLIVHGIGPQDDARLGHFREVLQKATFAALKRKGRRDLDCGRLLHIFTPVWARVRDSESSTWLHTLFPDSCNPLKITAAFFKLARASMVVAILVVVFAFLACWLLTLVLAPTLLGRFIAGVLGLLASMIVVGLLVWHRHVRFVPWSDLYRLGRPFQAHTLSDVVMYLSDGPRREIFQGVLNAVFKDKDAQAALTSLPDNEKASVMLCGHSWGSIINFDIVLGVTGSRGSVETGGKTASSTQRRLAQLKHHQAAVTKSGMTDPVEIEDLRKQIEFYEAVGKLYKEIEPVGMITMGSPIAFFLFRKPHLLGSSVAAQRRDLWKALWPQKEAGQDRRNGVCWRWQNFWHASDFVAHRLAPLYNEGFVDAEGQRRDFMTDMRVSQPVRGPIDAHSSYWKDPMVHRLIGEQLAQALIDLNPAPQSTTGSRTAEGRSAP